MDRGRAAIVLVAAFALACSSEKATPAGPPMDAGIDGGGPSPLTVMTFNVLCEGVCEVGGEFDPWTTRLDYFADLFQRHDPDLIGLQELVPQLTLPTNVEEILAAAPGREAIYYGPEGDLEYPDATILYRTSRFDLVESGDYWLSPTPDMPRSTGFSGGAQLPRLVVWAVLTDRTTGEDLFFATTHFDNNAPSQDESAKLVMERTLPWVLSHPVVFTGDFNSQPADAAFATLTAEESTRGFAFVDTQSIAGEWRVETNQDPVPDYDLAGRIDHLFVAGDGVDWSVREWVVDLTVYGPDRRYPSDHRAMVAVIEHAAR